MNFWDAQRKARSRTGIYVAIFVVLTLLCAMAVEYAMRHFAKSSYEPDEPIISFVFVAITFGVALFQYSMFTSYGGSYVAESVGGILIDPLACVPQEKQLLNIVQEMALAASLPMPAIYIIPARQINAFAAGTTPSNAAIAVTSGALAKLNRDELQGVIAHEFGHIYNADMKISLRLAAMVMGFFFVFYIALRLLQFSGLRSEGEREGDSRENKQGGNPVAIAALILIIAGALMWLFGSLLKCSVSREREYLADACAVQFTRNPNGICNALKKIGIDSKNDMPKEGAAYSHLYLDNHSGLSALFATHPPLAKRIAAIEGRTYLPDEWKKNLPLDAYQRKQDMHDRAG